MAYGQRLQENLQRAYGYETIAVINAGRREDTTADARRRVWADVIAHQPDLVLLCFGAYDRQRLSPEQFRENLSSLVATLQAETPAALILIVPPLPRPEGEMRPPEEPDPYAQAVRELGALADVPVVDWEALVSTAGRRQRELYYNEILPNAAGHRFLAEQLSALLGP